MPTQTISRCGGTTSGNYVTTVRGIAPVSTLRGYWRLGETVGNYLDSAGYLASPQADMSISGLGPNTRGVAGLLSPAQDDGAWLLSAKGSLSVTGTLAQPVGPGVFTTGTGSALTVVGWVKPTATVGGDPAFRGAIFNNADIIAGSPSFERGWDLELQWPGGASAPVPRFVRSNAAGSGGQVIATGGALNPGDGYMIAATFDGTTISLYVNGALETTQADTLRAIPESNGTYIGASVAGWLYGVVDEVAIWASVLSASNIATLYAAGV